MKLIRDDWLRKRAYNAPGFGSVKILTEHDINEAPAVMARPITYGQWRIEGPFETLSGEKVYVHLHEDCRYQTTTYLSEGTRFCPNCGAFMGPREDISLM